MIICVVIWTLHLCSVFSFLSGYNIQFVSVFYIKLTGLNYICFRIKEILAHDVYEHIAPPYRVGVDWRWSIDVGTNIQTHIARFMEPAWDPPGPCRPQMGPMLAPWTLLSGTVVIECLTAYLIYVLPLCSDWNDCLVIRHMCHSNRLPKINPLMGCILMLFIAIQFFYGEFEGNLDYWPSKWYC